MPNGIRFKEIMGGTVEPGRGTSPRVPAKDGWPFSFDLTLAITDLDAFRSAAIHMASIEGGSITWLNPNVDDRSSTPRIRKVATGGTVELFTKVGSGAGTKGLHKKFVFRFEFEDGGATYSVTGLKDLNDEPGIDIGSDMSTVFVSIADDTATDIAHGTVQVGVGDLIEQLKSIEPIPSSLSKAQKRAVKQSFFTFLNGQLRSIYTSVPLIFRDADTLSKAERKILRLAVQVFGPSPAKGPTPDEVVDRIAMFVESGASEEVERLRGWLQVFGAISPFKDDDASKLRAVVNPILKNEHHLLREPLDFLHQMVVFPYYSHRKADGVVGYARPDTAAFRAPASTNLPVKQKVAAASEFDYVIIGSGVAGSLVAERLSSAGNSVLVLESGPYVRERDIGTDELKSVATSYLKAGLQRANDGSDDFNQLTVLQAHCVGGGGVINNAVCFRLPRPRFDRWVAAGFPITWSDLHDAYDAVAKDLKIQPISSGTRKKERRLNPAFEFLEKRFGAVKMPDVGDQPSEGLWECLVNLNDCVSLGLCNLGCTAAKKKNSTQVYLKKAIAKGTVVVERAEVKEIVFDKNARDKVEQLLVSFGEGEPVAVKAAKEYVLTAGAIASSKLLLTSNAPPAPYGAGFSANIGAPIFAFVDRDVNDRPSVQIAHYVWPAGTDEGFVLETWYNPPGANSLAMPGHFDEHFERMLRYRRTISIAPLVRTEAHGQITVSGGQARISLPVGLAEFERLATGLGTIALALQDEGVSSIVGYGNGREVTTRTQALELANELKLAGRDKRKRKLLKLGTGHPQGGNKLAPENRGGVAGRDFKVNGVQNLRVCDASVFPESAGVNPQWTVMALAHLCSQAILSP